MTTIGQTLAAIREQAGYTLAGLSARTCIREQVIAAMERDDFRPCGGDFYARGHIRAVCKELNADAGPLVDQFDRQYAEGEALPVARAESLVAQSGHDPVPHQRPADGEGAPPDRSAGAPGAGGGHGGGPGPAAPGGGTVRVLSVATRRPWPFLVAAAIAVAAVIAAVQAWPGASANGGSAAPAAQEKGDDARQRAAAPQPVAAGGTGTLRVPSEPVEVALNAQERTWVRVTSGDGANLFTGVLDSGMRRAWSDPEELRLHVGNAGGLRMEVNGEDRGALGADGEVRHLVVGGS